MRCPNCHECPFERGVCGRLANRGRRFFLMGALALPVAAKIERAVPKLPYEKPALKYLGKINVNGRVWTYADDGYQRDGRLITVDIKAAEWAVAT